MNNINAYTNSLNNLKVDSGSLIEKINKDINKKEIYNGNNNEDKIEISEKNQTIINTKKAHDAFRDTCKEIGESSWGGYSSGDMSVAFVTILNFMEAEGIKTPNFFYGEDGGNLTNNNDFLGFLDKMESFCTERLFKDTGVPTKFFDFMYLFKEKLIQNGCR